MFFEQEYIVFELLEVLYLEQTNINMYNTNRNFDALSFRFEADTILSYEDKEIEVQKNSICYFPSNLEYTRVSNRDKMIVVHFKAFNYHSNDIQCFFPHNPEKYRKLFREIIDVWNKKELSYKNDCSALFYKILSEMFKDNYTMNLKDNKLSDALIYIHQNYLRSDFSLSDASAKSHFSETHFRRLFKQEFNVSPKKYVTNLRIEYAKALIITNYFTITEIAGMCGFTDEKHFSSIFKSITGISPSLYTYSFPT